MRNLLAYVTFGGLAVAEISRRLYLPLVGLGGRGVGGDKIGVGMRPTIEITPDELEIGWLTPTEMIQ